MLNMQLQLQEMSIPHAITVQKKLLSIFGTDGEGRATKELRDARAAVAGIAAGMKGSATTTTTTTMTTTTKTTAATRAKKGKEKAKGKGQGKEGGKKRQRKTRTRDDDDNDDNDDNDIDEEEEHEGGGGGEDEDSAWVGSDEEGGSDGDIDIDREERARIRHAAAMTKHRDLLAKHEEWSETHTILTGSKSDGRDRNAQVLNFDRSPPDFHNSWKKVSRLSKDRASVAMRGLALIDWTTWEWKNVSSNSFSRVMRTFAAAAIAQASVVISYRHEMILCDPHGGAATIRNRSQIVLRSFLVQKDPGQTSELRQTTLFKDSVGRSGSQRQGSSSSSKPARGLVLTEGKLPPKGCITWADGIYVTVPEDGLSVHVVEEQLARLQREKALGAQQRAVQKAIDGVQNLRVAWHDPTSKVNARENPRLDGDVAYALRSLVSVSAPTRSSSSSSHLLTSHSGLERQRLPSAREGDAYAGVRSRRGHRTRRTTSHRDSVRHAR